MGYFFVDAGRVQGDALLLGREDGRHVRHVLRMKAGDNLLVSDGSRYLYDVEIKGYPGGEVLCTIVKQRPLPLRAGPRITLFQSVPKGARMDWLVQKVSELGVHEIVPVYMERSVRTFSEAQALRRQDRWQRIAVQAAKQSDRVDYPHVGRPRPLPEALDHRADASLSLYFDEKEGDRFLKEIRCAVPKPEGIRLAVGPEGGLSAEDRLVLGGARFVPVSLGKRVLRTETAGMVAVALVQYEWDTAQAANAGRDS